MKRIYAALVVALLALCILSTIGYTQTVALERRMIALAEQVEQAQEQINEIRGRLGK